MAKKIVIDFEINGAQGSIKNVIELKEAIKTLENELDSSELGSEGFDKLKNQLDDLKGKYGELTETAAQKTGKMREKFMQGADDFEKFAKGVVDAVSGIAIAMGASEEDTKELMQGFMRFQAISVGLKGGVEAVITVVKNWSAVQRVLNLVLTANPIGVIIVLVASLATGIYFLIKNIDEVIAYLSDWRNAILLLLGPVGLLIGLWADFDDEQSEDAKKREAEAKQRAQRHKEAISDIDERRRKEKEAFSDRQEAYDMEIARADAEGKSSFELKLAKLKDIKEEKIAALNAINEKIQATFEFYTTEAALRGKSLDEFLKGLGITSATQQQLRDIQKKANDEIYKAETEIISLQTENDKKKAESAKDRADTILEMENASRIAIAELGILEAQTFEQRKMAEIELLREQHAIKLQDEKLTNDQILLLNKQLAADIYAIQQQLNDDIVKLQGQKIETVKTNANTEVEVQTNLYSLISQMAGRLWVEQQTQKEKDLKEDLDKVNKKIDYFSFYADSVKSLTTSIFTLTNNLGKQDDASKLERAKRQFQIKKSLDIVEAGINGAQSVVKGIAQFGPPPSPLGIAAIASSAIITAAQIAAIASAKFNPGSSSGGGVSSSPSLSVSQPNINTTSPTLNTQTLFSSGGGQTTSITPFGGNQQQQQPIVKAIVVDNEVTAMQKKTSNMFEMFSIG